MQDIQFALASQNSLRLTLGPFDEKLQLMWTHKVPQTDRDWAHQAVWLLAEAINHCYGVNDPHTGSTGRRALKRKIDVWELRRPDGFRPLHVSLADTTIGRPYPVVWFTKSLYATAIQHICMAKALVQEYELRNFYTSHKRDQDTSIEDAVTKKISASFSVSLSQVTVNPQSVLWRAMRYALAALGSAIHSHRGVS